MILEVLENHRKKQNKTICLQTIIPENSYKGLGDKFWKTLKILDPWKP